VGRRADRHDKRYCEEGEPSVSAAAHQRIPGAMRAPLTGYSLVELHVEQVDVDDGPAACATGAPDGAATAIAPAATTPRMSARALEEIRFMLVSACTRGDSVVVPPLRPPLRHANPQNSSSGSRKNRVVN
jgi:hypothetical protein